MKERLEKLIDTISYIRGGYTYQCTSNDYIKALEQGIEMMNDILDSENREEKDYYTIRILMEELIKVAGIQNPVTNNRRYKDKKIYELTCILKQKLLEIPYIEEKPILIENINDWIKSLKIFKLNGQHVSTDYYESSYDLYYDIRKMILKRNQPIYKKIYLEKVANVLDSENKDNILKTDFELHYLVKLIKDHPDFNYRLMQIRGKSVLSLVIHDRIEKGFWENRLRILIKRP